MTRSRRWAALLAAAALAMGCTSGEGTQPAPSGPPSPPLGSPTGTPSGPDSGPAARPGETPDQVETAGPGESGQEATASPSPALAPLALAASHLRGPIDLSAPVARRILAGRVDDWSELDQPPGPLRLVAAPGVEAPGARHVASAAAALRAATGSTRVLALVPASALTPAVRAPTVGGRSPLREPAAYPLRTEGPEAPEPVTLTIAGDIMLARRVALASGDDPSRPLSPLAARLAAADITVGNLESTLSRDGSPTQGDDSFAADPQVLDGLEAAGFDVLSLANNHLGDYGPRALVETVERVAASGIEVLGAGTDRRMAEAPVIVEADGLRVGMLAFNAIGESPPARQGSPGVAELRMPPRTGPLDRARLRGLQRQVRQLAREVDVVLVLPHWGDQYTPVAVPAQEQVAAALAEAGADLVIGGHPHVLQGLEQRSDTLVAYSLGNLVFDMDFREDTMEGALLELAFWDGELKAADLVPYRMDSAFVPREVGSAAAQEVLAPVWRVSPAPY